MDQIKEVGKFLWLLFTLETGTEAGRINLKTLGGLIFLAIVSFLSQESVQLVSAIFGHDSAEFPLVWVLVTLGVILAFCVTVIAFGEIFKERNSGG